MRKSVYRQKENYKKMISEHSFLKLISVFVVAVAEW